MNFLVFFEDVIYDPQGFVTLENNYIHASLIRVYKAKLNKQNIKNNPLD